MRVRSLVPAVLATALFAACDDRGITEPATRPSGAPLLAVSGGEASYAYACGRSIAPSQSTANRQIDSIYLQWKSRYIRDAGGGRLRVSNGIVPHDTTRNEDTYSEGIGYGMLIAAYLDDRPLFDGLWAYAKSYQVTYEGKSGLMAWHINADGSIQDKSFATDGDEDMAFALIVADKKWGGYRGEALTLLNNLLTHAVDANNVLLPGTWSGGGRVHPSYFDPAYYRTFAEYTGVSRWNDVAAMSYTILGRINAKGMNATTGLLPDYSTVNGDTAKNWNPATQQFDIDPESYDYEWDALRAPWRLARDLVWNCDGNAKSQLTLMNGFWKRVGPANITDGYRLDGTPLSRSYGFAHDNSFVSTAMTSSLFVGDSLHQAAMWNETMASSKYSYYETSLRLLTTLLASGNMPNPLSRIVDSFERGTISGWNTWKCSTCTMTVSPASPGALESRTALRLDYMIPASGGYGGAQRSYWNGSQNWSGTTGIAFWFKGGATGRQVQFELYDNMGSTSDSAERFSFRFTDDSAEWRRIYVPWSSLVRSSWQPAGAPNDGLTLTQVWGFNFAPLGVGSGTILVDQVELRK